MASNIEQLDTQELGAKIPKHKYHTGLRTTNSVLTTGKIGHDKKMRTYFSSPQQLRLVFMTKTPHPHELQWRYIGHQYKTVVRVKMSASAVTGKQPACSLINVYCTLMFGKCLNTHSTLYTVKHNQCLDQDLSAVRPQSAAQVFKG